MKGLPARSSSTTASASCVPVVQASSTPEPVSMLVEPEPSPMRAIAVAGQKGLAAAAGFVEGLRAPGAQGSVFEMRQRAGCWM